MQKRVFANPFDTMYGAVYANPCTDSRSDRRGGQWHNKDGKFTKKWHFEPYSTKSHCKRPKRGKRVGAAARKSGTRRAPRERGITVIARPSGPIMDVRDQMQNDFSPFALPSGSRVRGLLPSGL